MRFLIVRFLKPYSSNQKPPLNGVLRMSLNFLLYIYIFLIVYFIYFKITF